MTRSSVLRLACAQAPAVPARLLDTIGYAAETVRAAKDCRVVLFPELYLCGYDLDELRQDGSAFLAVDPSGRVSDPRLRPLAEAAEQTGALTICGAATVRADGSRRNSLLRFDGKGPPTVAYDKAYLWDGAEREVFTASAAGGSLEADGWKLGLSICYDCSFPEHARHSALAGSDVYLTSAAFLAGREYRGRVYAAARALENTVFSAFVNYSDGAEGSRFGGGTVVFGPDGRQVVAAAGSGEELVVAELRSGLIDETRTYLTMLRDCPRPTVSPGPSGAGPPAPGPVGRPQPPAAPSAGPAATSAPSAPGRAPAP